MICLDTNFLIRSLISASPEAANVGSWLKNGVAGKPAPSAGRTPSTLKKFGVTARPMICSGTPLPVRLAVAPRVAAMPANERFR